MCVCVSYLLHVVCDKSHIKAREALLGCVKDALSNGADLHTTDKQTHAPVHEQAHGNTCKRGTFMHMLHSVLVFHELYCTYLERSAVLCLVCEGGRRCLRWLGLVR